MAIDPNILFAAPQRTVQTPSISGLSSLMPANVQVREYRDYEKEAFERQKRADQQAEMARQQKLMQQQDADKSALTRYMQDGGDLHSIEGLERAKQELRGQLSVDAMTGLVKQLDETQKKETATKEKMAKLTDEELDIFSKKEEMTSRLFSAPISAYTQILKETGDEAKATAAFSQSRDQIVSTAKEAMTEIGGQPIYEQSFLNRAAKASPTDMLAMVQSSKWFGDRAKTEAAQRNSERRFANEEDRIKIAQQRLDTALEKGGGKDANPEDVAEAAEMISNYRLAPLSGFAMRTPYGQKVMAEVSRRNPDYDAKEYFTRAKSEKDFATGRQGNTIRSFNVAISHLNTLDALATALDNGDVQRVNQLANRVASETGKEAPVNFNAAKKIVGDEIVKAIVGTGGGVTDREEVARTISAINSPAQLKGVINTYKELMSGQLDGLRSQYKAATSRDDFDKKFLTEEARNARPERKAESGEKKEYRQVSKYKTPEQVRDDYKAGRITRDEARNVLTRMGF